MFVHKTLAVTAVAALLTTGIASAAHAAVRDSDGDGIPNRWEKRHGLNPHRAADARADFDKDGLRNLAEYRVGSDPRDEDTDSDGHDDGDEVRDGYRSTDLLDADTDDDGILDGDEDADRDGIDNEDEDDASERCKFDDEDRDGDNVDDEDENEMRGIRVGSADSDRDGILDGDEDADKDGEANEDEDDDAADVCGFDGNEDDGDLIGTIASFDSGTGLLTVTSTHGFTFTGVVTADTEIEFEEWDGEYATDAEEEAADRDATTADLRAGVQVAELDFDDDHRTLEEIAIYPTR